MANTSGSFKPRACGTLRRPMGKVRRALECRCCATAGRMRPTGCAVPSAPGGAASESSRLRHVDGAEWAVASAPGAASVRVWQVVSRGRDPRPGRPSPEGVHVAYPHVGRDDPAFRASPSRRPPGPLRPYHRAARAPHHEVLARSHQVGLRAQYRPAQARPDRAALAGDAGELATIKRFGYDWLLPEVFVRADSVAVDRAALKEAVCRISQQRCPAGPR